MPSHVADGLRNTPRSSIEQRLLISSLERALATLDTQEFKGKTVTVDFYGLTPDKDFAKEFFTAWLQGQQVQIATEPNQAQLHLKVFAPVLAVDQGQSFVGAPAFTVPILGFVMPEITLFKNARHSGHAEVEVFAIDGRTGKFVDKTPPAIGETNYDDYTILVVIHFTSSDIESGNGIGSRGLNGGYQSGTRNRYPFSRPSASGMKRRRKKQVKREI
jgi:hypothetical protein